MKVFSVCFISVFFGFVLSNCAQAATNKTAILIDKKNNKLFISSFDNGNYKILKTYHVTLGQVRGDKIEEGDLKTPEGIYIFETEHKPPTLKPKFGVLALYMNYPNAYDVLAGRTGSQIMLHATNEPERLKKNFDSEGCVVVKNEEILEIRPYVSVGFTPALIFSEFNDSYLKPNEEYHKIKEFFDSWIKAWGEKNIDSYMQHYHSDFRAKGMNYSSWKAHKEGLNKRYKDIIINPRDVRIFWHPKQAMISFIQDYESKTEGGRSAFKSMGTKFLYVATDLGKYKIIAEEYSNSTY